ncbi:MAG: helix-turn-helix domain-containing protein [Pseudomonadota bacterium]
MKKNTKFSQHAPHLYDLGYSPLPLAGKTARISDWPRRFCDERPQREQIIGEYSRAHRGRHTMNGIGLATYNGLMFIDIDADGAQHDEVYKIIRDVVPAIDRAPKIIGKRGAKYPLCLVDATNTTRLNLTGSQTDGQVELLVQRRLGVIPPTVHPDTAQPYSFDLSPNRQILYETHIDDLATVTLVQVEQLHEIFAVMKSATRPVKAARERIDAQRQAVSDRKKWNGDQLEMRRAAKALSYLDPNDEEIWWRVGAALKNWTDGHELARELFDTWAGGGSFMEIEFPGAPDKFNKTKSQDEAWAQDRPAIGYGTIIHWAQQQGFDATLNSWATLRWSRSQAAKEPHEQNTPFGLAAKQLPKADVEHFEAINAIRAAALNDKQLSKSDIRLFNQLLSFTNRKYGYAWPSYERLSDIIGISVEQLYKHAKRLERAGYIIRASNNPNPDGRTQTAFAILPPPSLTWSQLLERHRQQLGHRSGEIPAEIRRSETTLGQGGNTPAKTVEADDTFGAKKPRPKPDNLRRAGHASPDITNRESSSGGGYDGERLTPQRAGSGPRSIDHFIKDGLLENEKLIELMQTCSSEQLGGGVVQSILKMIDGALYGVDGTQQPDDKISLNDQQVRRAIDKAISSAFDPLRDNDKRKKRIDLDLSGGKASRECLMMFRDKFEIELGNSGYQTASYRQRKAAWKPK